MAGTATLLNVTRPEVVSHDATGEFSEYADDTGLVCVVDLYSNRRVIITFRLAFADYSGLQAEWEAGSATTVLKSSIDTYLAANADGGVVEELSSAQRAAIGYTYVIS